MSLVLTGDTYCVRIDVSPHPSSISIKLSILFWPRQTIYQAAMLIRFLLSHGIKTTPLTNHSIRFDNN